MATTWRVIAETKDASGNATLWSQSFDSNDAAEELRRFLESTPNTRLVLIEDKTRSGGRR